MLQPAVNVMVKAARAGGGVLLRNMHKLDALNVVEKARHDYASEVDGLAEEAIVKELRRAYPEYAVLGEEGGAFKLFAQALNLGRLGGGTQALGIAQGAYEHALAYAKKRHTFGKPLIQHQAIQFSLAEMATQIEASRALIYQVARWMDATNDITSRETATRCAMVKMQASDMAMKVTIDAVQIFGAYGNYRENHVERLMRDAKVTQLVDGPNELMKMRIGHALIREA